VENQSGNRDNIVDHNNTFTVSSETMDQPKRVNYKVTMSSMKSIKRARFIIACTYIRTSVY